MKKIALIVLFGILTGTVSGMASTIVQQVNIEQLTSNAQRIFLGKCVAAQSLRDDHGLPSTVYTFEIAQALKGINNRQLTIKQLGAINALSDGGVLQIPGMPQYQIGESYVLFLTEESELGFTSPQGFGQGAFRTFRDAATQRIAVENGNKNRLLFKNTSRDQTRNVREMKIQEEEDQALYLDDLLTLVAKLLKK